MRESGKKLILVADDDEHILTLVCDLLKEAGYTVLQARNSEEAINKAKKHSPDMMILDLRFPTIGGLEVCRMIKNDPHTKGIPILMLTVQADTVDKVIGLEAGADDYLGKPFDPQELLARVRAILRRSNPEETTGVLESGKIRVNLDRHQVLTDGKEVRLKPKEYDLLCYFLRYKNKVLTRETIMREVWSMDYYQGATRTIDMHIDQLRNKLHLKK